MIICECMGIEDHEIADSIASGARTVDEIGGACSAGTGCGGCQDLIERMLGPREVVHQEGTLHPLPV